MDESDADAGAADETRGRFLVTHADADSAVLKDVDGGGVHTLTENPGVEVDDVVEARLVPEPPLEVAWQPLELEVVLSVTVERSPEPPTGLASDLAADQPVGEVTRRDRAGDGELHVMTLEPGSVEATVAEVAEDEATRTMAARAGVARVELRWDDDEGVLSVRYLP